MNPMIHCCDKCLKPILIYGRMIPCKHVFCLGCAKQEERVCPRCRPESTICVKQYDNGKLGVETKCPELNKPDLAIFFSAPRVVVGTCFLYSVIEGK